MCEYVCMCMCVYVCKRGGGEGTARRMHGKVNGIELRTGVELPRKWMDLLKVQGSRQVGAKGYSTTCDETIAAHQLFSNNWLPIHAEQ